jgi:hypothetical protein
MTDSLVDAIRVAYDALPLVDGPHQPIHPFVGAACTGGDHATLRVMAVGVNAHGEVHHVPEPGRWALGFRRQEWRYQRRVLGALAKGLAGSAVASGWPFLGIESVYMTNAVKRWLPNAKRAQAVAEGWFVEGAPVLDAELAALAAVDRLPHIVVVVGSRPWGYVHPAFRPTKAPWVATCPHMGPKNRLFHYLKLVEVREAGMVRPLVLLRIRRSSASHWQRGWPPSRLLSEPTLRRVTGLGDNPGVAMGGIGHGA